MAPQFIRHSFKDLRSRVVILMRITNKSPFYNDMQIQYTYGISTYTPFMVIFFCTTNNITFFLLYVYRCIKGTNTYSILGKFYIVMMGF